MVRNPPATQEMQEMWVQSLGWEDSMEKGIATHSSLAWRIPWTRNLADSVRRVAKSRTQLKQLSTHMHTKHIADTL